MFGHNFPNRDLAITPHSSPSSPPSLPGRGFTATFSSFGISPSPTSFSFGSEPRSFENRSLPPAFSFTNNSKSIGFKFNPFTDISSRSTKEKEKDYPIVTEEIFSDDEEDLPPEKQWAKAFIKPPSEKPLKKKIDRKKGTARYHFKKLPSPYKKDSCEGNCHTPSSKHVRFTSTTFHAPKDLKQQLQKELKKAREEGKKIDIDFYDILLEEVHQAALNGIGKIEFSFPISEETFKYFEKRSKLRCKLYKKENEETENLDELGRKTYRAKVYLEETQDIEEM